MGSIACVLKFALSKFLSHHLVATGSTLQFDLTACRLASANVSLELAGSCSLLATFDSHLSVLPSVLPIL